MTTGYLPGKLYLDAFRLRIPEDVPPGEYLVEIGWFNSESGEQLDPRPETVKPPLKITVAVGAAAADRRQVKVKSSRS